MGLLTIGDETFNVIVEGADDAPTLMLSNSLGTTLAMWDRQMPALRDHFRVIRYDGRGHGESTAPGGPYGIDQLGRDALAIMNALDVGKVFWMGLSLGGMVGQWLLAHAPQRIERAVLANTAARMSGPDGWNARIAAVLAEGTGAITNAVIERWFTPAFVGAAPADVEPLVAMLHATSPYGYAGCCAAIRDMDLREGIRGANVPVLVVVGREDRSTPPAEGEAIAAAIPGAELVALDAAHLSNIEDEAAFTAAVVKFLTRRPRRVGAPRKTAAKRRTAATPAARKAPAKRKTTSVRKSAANAKPAAAKAPTAKPKPRKTAKPAAVKSARRPAARGKAASQVPAGGKRTTASRGKVAAAKTIVRRTAKPAGAPKRPAPKRKPAGRAPARRGRGQGASR